MPKSNNNALKQIYVSLAAVSEEVPAIPKTKKSHQGHLYRGVDDITNALKPILAKHKIVVMPRTIASSEGERHTAKGSSMQYAKVCVKYRFISAIDGSSTYAVVEGEATDTLDKALMKAYTYAYKTALTQVFNLATQEIVEAEEREEPTQAKTKEPRTLPKLPSKPEPIKTTTGLPVDKQNSLVAMSRLHERLGKLENNPKHPTFTTLSLQYKDVPLEEVNKDGAKLKALFVKKAIEYISDTLNLMRDDDIKPVVDVSNLEDKKPNELWQIYEALDRQLLEIHGEMIQN